MDLEKDTDESNDVEVEKVEVQETPVSKKSAKKQLVDDTSKKVADQQPDKADAPSKSKSDRRKVVKPELSKSDDDSEDPYAFKEPEEIQQPKKGREPSPETTPVGRKPKLTGSARLSKEPSALYYGSSVCQMRVHN